MVQTMFASNGDRLGVTGVCGGEAENVQEILEKAEAAEQGSRDIWKIPDMQIETEIRYRK